MGSEMVHDMICEQSLTVQSVTKYTKKVKETEEAQGAPKTMDQWKQRSKRGIQSSSYCGTRVMLILSTFLY